VAKFFAKRCEICAALDSNHLDIEFVIDLKEFGWIGEIALCHNDEGSDALIEGDDERSIDKAMTGFGICRRDHDADLIDIRDDHSLKLSRVINGARQDIRPWLDYDYSTQRTFCTRDISDDRDEIANDNRFLTKFT
jgi:hypothetical protein